MVSANFRSFNGSVDIDAGAGESGAVRDRVLVPIFRGDERWGAVEIQFAQSEAPWLPGFANNTLVLLILFIFASGMALFPVFLKRVLSELDPSKVIPARVKAAFDTLAEGILILDEQGSIVLANQAFNKSLSMSDDRLIGRRASSLSWRVGDRDTSSDRVANFMPWDMVLESGQPHKGGRISILRGEDELRSFAVNCTPIADDKDGIRGVIATFDDLTELEEKNEKLKATLLDLKKSKAAVDEKSKELEFLATRDPLTGCLNRRSFNESLEALYAREQTEEDNLICMMVDIDHFKRINDNYGHGMGDTVIKFVAETISANIRPNDLLARYGGEEFCVVLDGVPLEAAREIAERVRHAIMEGDPSAFTSTIRVTASFGLAGCSDKHEHKEHFINDADRALYRAKQTGRNRVIAWEDVSGQVFQDPNEPLPRETSEEVPAGEEELQVNQEVANRLQELERIAEERAAELDHLLSHDSLTDLPSRQLFIDRVEQAVRQSRRSNDLTVVLSLGLSDLSRVSDTLGYESAEQLIKVTADRLRDVLRDSDSVSLFEADGTDLELSKLGHGEFGLLFTAVRDNEALTWMVRRIFDTLREPIFVDDHSLAVSSNIGIAVFPDDADDGLELIKRANISRYHAEQLPGSNNVEYFSKAIGQFSREQLMVESQLADAIANKEFELHYQPKIDLVSGDICGFESLLRWRHPQRGLLGPAEFIAVAENTRHINAIGDWVLEESCRFIKYCEEQTGRSLQIAVNMSPIQWSQVDLVARILDTLQRLEVEPDRLELELTESCLMDNMEITLEALHALKARGVNVSVDDFGTGYSSLGYLRKLPVDTLKVDRCFISDMHSSDSDRTLVSAIISMARALGLCVVAEGVEEQVQLEMLREMDCDQAQGYFFSKPLPQDDAIALFSTEKVIAQA